MDAVAALRTLVEWGVDEALEDAPRARFAMPQAPAADTSLAPVRPQAAPRPALAASAPIQQAEQLAASATSLEALRAALAGFDGCALRATATNLVFTDGNPSAGLLVIGEGPGAEEDRAGRPFVGASGRLLDKMLGSVGLDRSNYLISNIIFWRPPGNRTPTDQEVALCLPFMWRLLALTRPRRVLLLGKLAASSLSGSQLGIRRLRGQWLPLAVPGLEAPVPALATLHPAYLLRTPAAKREAWMDMLALRAALDSDASDAG